MADFDDASDPVLGAACNRLAAFVEPLPEEALLDAASQLTERDLALILRHLYVTRHGGRAQPPAGNPAGRSSRASVPITAKS